MDAPTQLDPDTFGPSSPCFGCSPAHPTGLRLRFAREGEVIGRGRVAKDGHRVLTIATTLEQSDAVVFEGSFRVALLDERSAERLLGSELPDEWKRFCRQRADRNTPTVLRSAASAARRGFEARLSALREDAPRHVEAER